MLMKFYMNSIMKALKNRRFFTWKILTSSQSGKGGSSSPISAMPAISFGKTILIDDIFYCMIKGLLSHSIIYFFQVLLQPPMELPPSELPFSGLAGENSPKRDMVMESS